MGKNYSISTLEIRLPVNLFRLFRSDPLGTVELLPDLSPERLPDFQDNSFRQRLVLLRSPGVIWKIKSSELLRFGYNSNEAPGETGLNPSLSFFLDFLG